jgi:hypothetical protein
MKANPMGMLWMIPTGWPDHPLKAAWPGRKVPPQGSSVARMNKFTLLEDATGDCGGAATGRGTGKAGPRRQAARLHDAGGERRHLFGAGEGSAEAATEAKQETMGVKRKQFVKKFVSEQWILSCKSLGRPLVYHL